MFKSRYIVIALLLFLAFSLRVYRLGSQGFWYDEAKVVSMANEFGIMDAGCEEDVAKPVFPFLVLRPWIRLFGLGEFSCRMPAVILGVISVFFIYRLGLLMFGLEVGLLAAYLLALSEMSIYHSQQAFYSSAEIPVVILSMYLFFRLIKEKKGFIALCIVNSLTIYTFVSCFLIVAVQNLALPLLGIRDKKFLKKWFLSQAAILLVFLSWWVVFRRLSTVSHAFYWITQPGLSALLGTLENFSHGVYRFALGGAGFITASKYLLIPRFIAAVYLVLLSYGLFARKEEQGAGPRNALLLWLVFPVASLFLFSRLFFPVYTDRYVMYAAGAYYLLVAFGISRIKRPWVKAALVALIGLLHLAPLRLLYEPSLTNIGEARGWEEIAAQVSAGAAPGDAVVFSPLRQIVPFWYYYDKDKRTDKNIQEMAYEPKERWQEVYYKDAISFLGPSLGEPEEFITRHEGYLKSAGSVWLVLSPYWPGQEGVKELLLKYFSGWGRIEEHDFYPFHGVEVYKFSSGR